MLLIDFAAIWLQRWNLDWDFVVWEDLKLIQNYLRPKNWHKRARDDLQKCI